MIIGKARELISRKGDDFFLVIAAKLTFRKFDLSLVADIELFDCVIEFVMHAAELVKRFTSIHRNRAAILVDNSMFERDEFAVFNAQVGTFSACIDLKSFGGSVCLLKTTATQSNNFAEI